MKKLLSSLLLLFFLVVPAAADETISLGLTLKIPSPGQTNWQDLFKTQFAQPISSHDHTGGGKGVQLSASALSDNAITGTKIRLANDQWLRARNFANSADVNILKVNASNVIEFASIPINAGIPSGAMFSYGGSAAPTGYFLCDGSAVSRTTYSALFTAIGTTYGTGDGSTTFNLPDARQRFLLSKAASGTGSTLGSTGGNIDHTHSAPAHHHGMGTGADLNITSGGAHLHAIDHDHASQTSTGTAPTTDSQGNHQHFTVTDSLDGLTLSGSNYKERSFAGGGGVFAYDLKGTNTPASIGLTSSTGAHTHTVNSHTHAVDLPNFTGSSNTTSHTHTSGTFAGRIGLVTGGVDGNAAMTSGTGNPPYLVTNCIIKQ